LKQNAYGDVSMRSMKPELTYDINNV